MTQAAATVFELADRLLELRDRKAELEELLKEVNAEIERTNQQLVEAMVAEELQSFVRGDKLFYLRTETYVSPAAERKPELIEWLKANGLGDIVQETVHPRTLSAAVKEMLEEDDELPPDLAELVNVFEKTTVSLRRAGR
nr:MAG: hypothetical protein DIU58_18110 [Sphaerobacter thermophilus]